MPIEPNFLERLILLRLNQGPGIFLDILSAGAFQAVLAALRLGVFEALREGPQSGPAIAQALASDERGMTALLGALEALGYLRLKDGRYSNTPLTTKWLLRDAPRSLAHGLEFWGLLIFDLWSDLATSVREGQPRTRFYEQWLDERPGAWRAFQEFMATGAQSMAREIVERVPLPATARRLLDVAGGHGLYSVAFCRCYPQLEATVFDLEGAVAAAREFIAEEQMAGQVTTATGDLLADDLGAGYDVVLLFNILHTYQPDQNRALLGKVARSLNPGGMVIILEQLASEGSGSFGRAFTRLSDLNFFHQVGGRSYSVDELAGLLRDAGLRKPRSLMLRSLPGNGVVFGVWNG